MTTPAAVVVSAIAVYQNAISPWIGRHCRFVPTCSEYARLAVMEHGVVRGTGLAVRRLLKCQPFHDGGYDPPPKARRGQS